MSSDLYGPLPVNSYQGDRYIDTLLDTATKWLEIRFLKSKKDALAAFKIMKIAAENQSGKTIKILRTDWGKEFENHEFQKYLADYGILYKYLVLYTLE